MFPGRRECGERLKNIRELVDVPIPLHETPAARLLALQVDRNVAHFRGEDPRVISQVIALRVAHRMLEIPMYNRISGQPFYGPKSYERVDTYEDAQRKQSGVIRAIHQVATELEADASNKMEFENAWMYVTRNRRGDTAYRIYLSPEVMHVAEIFRDLAMSVPRDLGFQMKTFDDQAGYAELARNDKIILYASDTSVDRLFQTVREVYARHQSAFSGRLFPPGGLPTEMSGVSVARQSKEKSQLGNKTGTEIVAQDLDERITERASALVRGRFEAYRDRLMEVSVNDEGRFLCATLVKLGEGNKWHTDRQWPGPEHAFSEEVRKQVGAAFGRAVYRSLAGALVQGSRRQSQTDIHRFFCEELRSVSLTSPQRNAFASAPSAGAMVMFGLREDEIVRNAIRMTGVGMAIHSGMVSGQGAGEAFRAFLAE